LEHGKTGRSDLQDWLDSRRPALDALNAAFAAKYGWGNAG